MYVVMKGTSGKWKKMPKTHIFTCSIAEAQGLLNKLKREEYVGPLYLDLKVRELKSTLPPSKLLTRSLT